MGHIGRYLLEREVVLSVEEEHILENVDACGELLSNCRVVLLRHSAVFESSRVGCPVVDEVGTGSAHGPAERNDTHQCFHDGAIAPGASVRIIMLLHITGRGIVEGGDEAGVGTDLPPRRYLNIELGTCVVLVVGVGAHLNHTILVLVSSRQIVVHLVRLARDVDVVCSRKSVVLDIGICGVEELEAEILIPGCHVVVVGIVCRVGFPLVDGFKHLRRPATRIGIACVGLVAVVIVDGWVVHVVGLHGQSAPVEVAIVVHSHLLRVSCLRGYENHTVGSSRTVDGR